jgi:hypothetical protein
VADFNLQQPATIEFLVYNAQGILLSTEKVSFDMGNTKKLIKSSLPSGLYLVATICNGKFTTQKVII